MRRKVTHHSLLISRFLLNLSLLTALLAACAHATATPDQNIALTAAFETAFAQISAPTATLAPTETPIPTATVPRTPPALPGIVQTSYLNPEDLPRSYVTDSCQYLKNKWDSTKSAPGTTVMIIMSHRIDSDATTSNAGTTTIAAKDLKQLMNDFHELGFQAINMQQMADFMYDNAKIPQRSFLFIVDDRAGGRSKYDDHFRTYYEQWGWPIVNAYIGIDERPDLWAEHAALGAEGWVDFQAHGYIHNIPISDGSTDEFISSEMGGVITTFQKYFNKTPIAYIWPGGGFSKRAVEIGTQLGYKLGFTVNPRGPVMYNWVPQADTVNASNPLAIPETPAGNPLMTLPRYMDINARDNIGTVIAIGDEAAAYAEQNKATELEYYDIVCAPSYGPIP
ncbi:MAG: polysaccharide deacetylase family protein [Anaerolineae bacterium]|nr:polysaccharide deacetylase family protein [Anaerolineae bacterium]